MQEGTRKEPRKPKQAAIIQAAAELFVQHGYDGTSTEMIAEKAGVSRQTIYNQFESKEALFLAIGASLVSEVVAPLAETVEGAGDLHRTLLAFGRRTLTTLLCPRTIALYRLVVTEAPRFPDLARAVDEANFTAVENELAKYLDGHCNLRIPDSKLAARQLLALIVQPIAFRALLGVGADAGDAEIAHHIDAAVDTFLRAHVLPAS
jgi:AcrR family transcriptional regulator